MIHSKHTFCNLHHDCYLIVLTGHGRGHIYSSHSLSLSLSIHVVILVQRAKKLSSAADKLHCNITVHSVTDALICA